MEDSPEKTFDTNPERADLINELNDALRTLDYKKPTLSSNPDIKKAIDMISGGLKAPEDLKNIREKRHEILGEQVREPKENPVALNIPKLPLPQNPYIEARRTLESHAQKDKIRDVEVMNFFSRGRRSLDEFFQDKRIQGLTRRATDAKSSWMEAIQRLQDRDMLRNFGNGIYGAAALRGGSDNLQDEETSVPESLSPEPPPVVQQDEIISGELPYPDGFVAEPPPVVKKISASPYIDSSGEGFLGRPNFDRPSLSSPKLVARVINDESNYSKDAKVNNAFSMRYLETPETVPESPLHKKFVDKLNSIISKTSGRLATTLATFSEFKVAHKKFEDILNNLPSITGLVPDTEYAQLATIAEEGAAEESGNLARFEPEIITDAPEPPPVVEQEKVLPPPVIENQEENFEKRLILDAGAFTVASDRHSGHNEDKFLEYNDGKTFGVFDGMGGVEGGERASMLAMKNVQEHVSQIPADASVEEVRQTLKAILEDANRVVFNDPFQSGKDASERMGTTATIVKIVEDVLGEKKVVVASVGDSRVYIYRADGDFEQVTIDANRAHAEMKREGKTEDEIRAFQKKSNNASSLSAFDNTNPAQRMSEIMRYEQRNEIASALGVLEKTTVDTYVRDLHNGDITLVTSDGVHDNLTDNEIEFYITACVKKGFTADEISKFLVEKALERSRQVDPSDPTKKHFRAKSDDITALVFKIKPINKVQESTFSNAARREFKVDPLDLQKIITPVEDPVSRVKALNGHVTEADFAHLDLDGAEVMSRIKPILPEVGTLEKVSPYAEVDFNKLTERYTHTKESLQNDLTKARQAFAQQEALYKQEINKGKKSYHEIMARLGVPGKQRPLPTKTPEYLEAEKAHMEAKWNLKNFNAGLNIKEVPIERSHSNSLIASREGEVKIVDVGVFEKMETENRVFWNTVESFMPEKEKKNWRRKVDAGLEAWSRIPLAARLPLTTVILVGGTYLAGNIGVAAALSTAGWRIGRAALGTGAALKTGKYFDGIKRKKREGDREERKSDYDGAILSEKESFSKIDEASRQKIEKENKEIKNDRLKKAGIMAAVGGIATVGTGFVQSVATDVFATPGVKINPDINSGTKPKGSFLDKLVKKQPLSESTSAPKVAVPEKIVETPVEAEYTTPVEVNLSSKGFIDTVDQLKQATAGQKLTPALEKLLSQSPQKIAMDLGLFKPGQAAESAFGFQGEQLAIDAEGNVSLVHNSGATEVLMDSKGTLKPYAGKMFDADHELTSSLPGDMSPAPKVAEVIPQTPKPITEPVEEVSSGVEIKSSVSKLDVAADAVTPAAALVEVKPRVPLEFDQTVIKSPEYTGPIDMISGKLPLKPEYQFDPKYKPERIAYNIQLEKAMMSMTPDMFDLRFPIEYNGGRINVFQKGKDILILLNGQKIGTGLIINGQPGLQYEKGLGTGIFGVKTDFEKAFEEAQKAIMKNKMFFKKTQ